MALIVSFCQVFFSAICLSQEASSTPGGGRVSRQASSSSRRSRSVGSVLVWPRLPHGHVRARERLVRAHARTLRAGCARGSLRAGCARGGLRAGCGTAAHPVPGPRCPGLELFTSAGSTSAPGAAAALRFGRVSAGTAGSIPRAKEVRASDSVRAVDVRAVDVRAVGMPRTSARRKGTLGREAGRREGRVQGRSAYPVRPRKCLAKWQTCAALVVVHEATPPALCLASTRPPPW